MTRESDEGKQKRQLTLISIFWLTTAAALVLAYARGQGEEAVFEAMIYAGFVLVAGIVVGISTGGLHNTLFWAALITLLAFVAVAGGRLPNQAVSLGWGVVGAGCGAISGAQLPKRLWAGIACTAMLGSILMTVCVLAFREPISQLVFFDIVCAGIVGLLIRPFVQFLQWFEARSKQPRIVLASWLTLCVLLGNYLVPIIGGVQR